MNPYRSLPDHSFWRKAVADKDMLSIGELWTPKFELLPGDAIVTAGSCFAQHIGRALAGQGMNWLDAEPAPAGLAEPERRRLQYGAFSCRTGNIYTTAVLRQWLAWAFETASPPDETWTEGERCFDPFRPTVEPDGFASVEALCQSRQTTLQAIRTAVGAASCLVFTLGLTEAWQNQLDGSVYPVCPGTVRGQFDPARHRFRNFGFDEVYQDLAAAVELMRRVNPRLRILLTVSPVPLTATATGGHALTATTYSKAVLRAVAGQFADAHAYVDYFPSYELITSFPFRGVFFEPNMRSVSAHGVDFVMRQFFAALSRQAARRSLATIAAEDFFCEDAVLDYYKQR